MKAAAGHFFLVLTCVVAADVKPVVVLLPEVLEFRLRGDASKFSNFYYWARTARAWYCLKSPHGEFAAWWKEQAAQMALMPLVEREVTAKNPRSFERVVARLCKELPGQKVDTTDFVDRFGAFILKQFEAVHGSEFLDERAKADDAGGASATGTAAGGTGLSPNAAVAKKASHGVEDMTLPGAESAPKMQFERLVCPIPASHLLDLFSVTEFVGAFGQLVLGQDAPLAPSQLIEWVTSRSVPSEYEMLLRELMNFIGNEG